MTRAPDVPGGSDLRYVSAISDSAGETSRHAVGWDASDLSQAFRGATTFEVIELVWQRLGPRVAASSSFQTQSLPLLHTISQAAPEMPVLFLDTGYHFPETLAYRDRIAALLGLNVKVLRASAASRPTAGSSGDLYRVDPDRCCWINKVEPLEHELRGLDAWITGIRRDQTRHRAATPIASKLPSGAWKVCPMLEWTADDVWAFIAEHQLPPHPLFDTGYRSVGCAPCTRPVGPASGDRDGRWAGSSKTECGLHLSTEDEDSP